MRPLHDLTELLTYLPGLGPRQARRVVQYILTRDQSFRDQLATLIQSIGIGALQCTRCYRFDDSTGTALCRTCADDSRDQSLLMVVEHDSDIDAVEASLTYRGYYLVLGGHLTMTKARRSGREPRIAELVARVTSGGITEVICALAATPEGDYTAGEINSELRAVHPTLRVSTLGRGLSVGAELEYADPETVRSALKNRS